MKKAITVLGILMFSISLSITKPINLEAKPTPKAKINWMSFEKAAAYMKETPKKVYIDVYTTTCHWCKVMSATTLSNRNVIKYLNENFYCVKFNANSKQDISFNGVVYNYDTKNRVHELAIELMNGRLSYPTSVFLEENFKQAQPVPGYLKLKDMEMVLKYMGENKNKTTPWEKHKAEFKALWK